MYGKVIVACVLLVFFAVRLFSLFCLYFSQCLLWNNRIYFSEITRGKIDIKEHAFPIYVTYILYVCTRRKVNELIVHKITIDEKIPIAVIHINTKHNNWCLASNFLFDFVCFTS